MLLTWSPPARGRRAPRRGVFMGSGTRLRLEPYEVALLRGGPRAAVTVAVLALYLRGAAEAGRPGTVRVSGEPVGAGQALSPLAEAVLAELRQPVGVRELSGRPGVRRAVADIRRGLMAAGLLRCLPARRTRAGRRTLDALHAGHPLPRDRKTLSADEAPMAVALHGDPALRLVAGRFALRAGLIPRVEVADKGLLRHSPRSEYSCGGVSD
ncbi:TIGR04222 domain-containing membrane protein [Streptomyces cellulosae]|uniref:TIGR04222 domain-containing membrane protein n=1 Tax=Streptomyces cellulosae TaxID=1968 RepID=UPI00227721BB|nr:TIGR04222 domain-containing membrane protein [Streptomyces cellulosae]